jgi:hypothetical protein
MQLPCSAIILGWASTLALLASDAHPTAVLWTPPGNISLSDWIWGPGGEQRAPKPPFQFIDEDFKGTNPKIRVRDAKGDEWVVKFGSENHGDVFAPRLLYACGYIAQATYFVASGGIRGVTELKRAKPFISKDGRFAYARFKLRDHKSFVTTEDRTWSWADNAFLGTHELNGLKILMMLTSNWDAKDARDGPESNLAVFSARRSPGKSLYVADDWGSSMGKWGGFFERDKWDSAGYEKQTKDFVKTVNAGVIEWGYGGKHDEDIKTAITVDDVRWLLQYLSAITDDELKAGLRASGANERDIESFTRSIRDRIRQLENISKTNSAVH